MPKHPHEILLDELRAEYRAILDGSKQAIYVYLDNEHKVCNAKFAAMLGYKTPRDWETIDDPMVDVDGSSINLLVGAYSSAMESKIGSTIDVTWKKHGGGSIRTTVMLVPISFKGEMMALHYIAVR